MKGKYIVISTIIGIILIFGAFYYTKALDKQVTEAPLDETLQVATIQALNEIGTDEDNDGLSDWEERLWGTDPKNPDTDGDGTLDGEETKTKRDPTKAGPDDIIAPKITENNQETTPSALFTQGSFAQAYAEIYAKLSAGETLSAEQKEYLGEKLVADISGNPVLQSKKDITLEDLNLTKNNTQSGYENYKQNFLSAVKTTSPKEPENEAVVLARAMQTKNKADFDKINEIGKSHSALADILLTIETPSNIAITHLEIINTLYSLSFADAGMARINSDPITGIAALQRYVTETTRLSSALANLSNDFKKNNIVF